MLWTSTFHQQLIPQQHDSPKQSPQTEAMHKSEPRKKLSHFTEKKADKKTRTWVASLRKTLLVACLLKYVRNDDFHVVSPNRIEVGCKNTLSLFRSKNLNSLARFSRWTVPACTLSNLMADFGRWTRATRGQSPPRIPALIRLQLELFALRYGSSAFDEKGINPVSVRFENKSWRKDVISRMEEIEIKFYNQVVQQKSRRMER